MTRGSDCTSAGVPSTSFSPWTRHGTRSQRLKMNRMSCSITTTARPVSRILKISSSACRVSCGFMPAVGSSSRSSRVGGQGAGDLEPALVAVGQVPGEVLGRPCRARRSRAAPGPLPGRRLLAAELRPAQDRGERARLGPAVAADQDVLQRRHVGEQPDVLERPGDARLDDLAAAWAAGPLPSNDDLALGGQVQAGEAVEERGLAGAVGADQADDLALAGRRGRRR